MKWKRISLLTATRLIHVKYSIAFSNPPIRVVNLRSLPNFQLTHFSHTQHVNMPRGVKKENLPSKVCVTCGRPFTWRKKWEKVWDEVTTCSKSCNHKRRLANRQTGKNARNTTEIIDKERRDTIPVQLETELTDKIFETLEITDRDTNTSDEQRGGQVSNDTTYQDPITLAKQQRKALKKAKKAERRAQREGRGDPSAGQKPCDMCGKQVNLLIRCMYEEGQIDWKMVCGKCWKVASGGVVDGDESHPHYRYGGLWKNRRAQT